VSGPLLELRDATRRYRGGGAREVLALDRVTLAVEPGSFVAVSGPSGGGKTTLLALLALLDRPTAGRVLLEGRDLAGVSEAERSRLRRRLGIVFQATPAIRGLPVWENVTYPLIPLGAGGRERRARAAALLERVGTAPAIVVGTSSGAMIAVDLAVRRPDLVQTVIEHEGPWRFTRHLPTGSQVAVFATMGALVLRGRHGDAAEALLRSAYGYRDGGSAWDAFPEEWRRAGRENAKAALWDFLSTIGNYPPASDLATVKVPVVCSYGGRSPDFMVRRTRSLASAIPGARTHRIDGAGHAAPFDATANFVQLIADSMRWEGSMS
jgi:pimeloyl-ACP methyl ester carboxylesterase